MEVAQASRTYSHSKTDPVAVAVFLLDHALESTARVLEGDDLGTAAELVPGLSYPVMQFVVLGASQILVESSNIGEHLAAIRGVEQAVVVFLLRSGPAVVGYR